MSLLRRSRGALLRIVRHRRLAMILGLVMILPSAYIQFDRRLDAWWLEGLSLVVGATGLALFWTGLTGVSPDWVDRESR
jgi:ABC-type transport system involved in cytochrome c biogenesis permease component